MASADGKYYSSRKCMARMSENVDIVILEAAPTVAPLNRFYMLSRHRNNRIIIIIKSKRHA